MLVPSVQRRREKRAFAPFKGLSLTAAVLPNRRRPAAADNVNQTFEKVLLWLEGPARRDLAYITIVHALGPVQIEINAAATYTRPWVKLDLVDVFNVKAAHCGDTFLFKK